MVGGKEIEDFGPVYTFTAVEYFVVTCFLFGFAIKLAALVNETDVDLKKYLVQLHERCTRMKVLALEKKIYY